MAILHKLKPPPEFCAGQFPSPKDAAGWYRRLAAHVQTTKAASNFLNDATITPAELWQSYVLAIRAADTEAPPLKPIEEISVSVLRTNAEAVATWDMEVLGKRCFLLDPGSGDKELLDAFKGWLAEVRKTDSLPLKRRGRPSTNVTVTEDHLDTWGQNHVLAVLALDYWAMVNGREKYSYPDLAALIFTDKSQAHADPKERGRAARMAAKEALDSLEMLAFIAHNGG